MQVDKDDIDVPIVVARVGHSIGSVVVKETEIDICIRRRKDLQIEASELAQAAWNLGQIGLGTVARAIAPRQHLAIDVKPSVRHLAVEMGKTAGQLIVERSFAQEGAESLALSSANWAKIPSALRCSGVCATCCADDSNAAQANSAARAWTGRRKRRKRNNLHAIPLDRHTSKLIDWYLPTLADEVFGFAAIGEKDRRG